MGYMGIDAARPRRGMSEGRMRGTRSKIVGGADPPRCKMALRLVWEVAKLCEPIRARGGAERKAFSGE